MRDGVAAQIIIHDARRDYEGAFANWPFAPPPASSTHHLLLNWTLAR